MEPDGERAEALALEDFYLGVPEHQRRAHGVVAERVASSLCLVFPGLEPPLVFNRVLLLGVGEATSDGDLDEVSAFMAARTQRWQISLAPSAEPRDLPQILASRGFVPGYAWAKFRHDERQQRDAPTDLEIRRLTPADGEPMLDVIREGFGLGPVCTPWLLAMLENPRFTVLGAFADRELAAVGALWCGGNLAWLGFGATRTEYRRRGAQSALLAARIREARACDATPFTETGVPAEGKASNSYRNILRGGFSIDYVRENLVAPAR